MIADELRIMLALHLWIHNLYCTYFQNSPKPKVGNLKKVRLFSKRILFSWIYLLFKMCVLASVNLLPNFISLYDIKENHINCFFSISKRDHVYTIFLLIFMRRILYVLLLSLTVTVILYECESWWSTTLFGPARLPLCHTIRFVEVTLHI